MTVVQVDQRGSTLVVAMRRPEKRNAINRPMAEAIGAALDRLDDDDDLRVGVLTGTADLFSAGTDLVAGADARTDRGGEYGMIRRDRRKPLIAAVEGVCHGGGMEMVLACDLVVASTDARFALPEARRGLVPSSGGLFRAIRSLPLHVVKELMITSRSLTGERAYQLGLVNQLTPPGQALEAAIEMAADVCRSSPFAVLTVLSALANQLQEADRAGWAATAQAVEAVIGSADLREGVSAFFERREPRWTGA